MDSEKLKAGLLRSFFVICCASIAMALIYSTGLILLEGYLSPVGAWNYFVQNIALIPIPAILAFGIFLILSIFLGLVLFAVQRVFRLRKTSLLFATILLGAIGGYLFPLLVLDLHAMQKPLLYTNAGFGGLFGLVYWRAIVSKW
jgi:hypothetical protein